MTMKLMKSPLHVAKGWSYPKVTFACGSLHVSGAVHFTSLGKKRNKIDNYGNKRLDMDTERMRLEAKEQRAMIELCIHTSIIVRSQPLSSVCGISLSLVSTTPIYPLLSWSSASATLFDFTWCMYMNTKGPIMLAWLLLLHHVPFHIIMQISWL